MRIVKVMDLLCRLDSMKTEVIKKRSKPGKRKRNGNHTAIYKTMAITEENFLLQ
jgi:hypothetical protein